MNVIDQVAAVAAAYFAKNEVDPQEVPNVLRDIREALEGEGNFQPSETPGAIYRDEPERQSQRERDFAGLIPARRLSDREIKNSITDQHIISFEDGRNYKTMKRHLSRVGLTPEEYRAKWGLPVDYPMTSPEYSERRSELAKDLGLGTGQNRGNRGRANQPSRANQGSEGPRKPGGQPGNRNAQTANRGRGRG